MGDEPANNPQSDAPAPGDNATVEAAASATATAGVPALPFALQNGERVVLFSRRHWVFLWPRLALHALYGVAGVVGVGWIANRVSGLDGTSGKVFWVAAAIWIVYWAVRCYFDWYSYYHDIWVVTNQRIIDSIKPNFFNSRLASADLVDVEDISVQHSGILATAFKYGDLRCQTAGEQPNFVLGGVPDPTHILSVVDASRDLARRESGRGWR